MLHLNDNTPETSLLVKELPDIEAIMLSILQDARPTLLDLANHYAMSTRSIQRKLQACQLNFVEILNTLLHQQAIEHLNNSHLSINDISLKLHYSDPSHFIRAFKKREGTTPQNYRKSQNGNNSDSKKNTMAQQSGNNNLIPGTSS